MTKEFRGWHSRGYLPHFDGGERAQFITFNLYDSVPKTVIEQWRLELATEAEETAQMMLRQRIEKYLDSGYGACYLRQIEIAELVQNSLLHFDGSRYRLRSWVIMPNHVHFLFTPKIPLSDLIHSIKSYTATKVNKLLNRRGDFWQPDYFDRYIRDDKHFIDTVRYIENNPVKANLCQKPNEWRFSSASF